MRVAIYRSSNRRSHIITKAIAQGISAAGDQPTIVPVGRYSGPESEAAVHYGMRSPFDRIHGDYVREGKPVVYIDLGYWQRHLVCSGGRWLGYHKTVVGAIHATEYFQRRAHDEKRWKHLGIPLLPRRFDGTRILLAGMSSKSAETNGYKTEEFERWAVDELRRVTTRKIIYRPKPSWGGAAPIAGADYSHKGSRLDGELARTWAVVTHHSNVACDAIVAGVPAYCIEGIAGAVGIPNLDLVETPRFPTDDERWQWCCDAAYCQWNIAEMQSGEAWRYLRDEGLVR